MKENYLRFIVALAAALTAVTLLLAAETKTIITGDEMEITRGGERIVFTGNSKVVRGESVLQADRLLQDKKNNRVEASGKIRFKTFSQDGELILGTSEKAFFLPEAGQGELFEGRPHMVYHAKDSTGPVRLTADTIAFDQQKEEIFARGSVEIISSSVCASAPSAVFVQKEKKVVLTGTSPQPNIVYLQEDGRSDYTAERITVYLEQHKVFLEGGVHGTLISREMPGETAGK